VQLCTAQIGAHLPVYGALALGAGGEEEAAAAEYVQDVFALMPPSCLEAVSLAASRARQVTEQALPLLCQPGASRLYLVGPFGDKALAR
jgi:hypothetical protein